MAKTIAVLLILCAVCCRAVTVSERGEVPQFVCCSLCRMLDGRDDFELKRSPPWDANESGVHAAREEAINGESDGMKCNEKGAG